MIRLLIEVVPFGLEHRKKDLVEITISNNGLSLNRPTNGNYDIRYKDKIYENAIQEYKRSNGVIPLASLTLKHLLKESS